MQHQHPRERSERGSWTARPKAEPSAFFIDVFAPSGSPEANPRRKKVAPCIQQRLNVLSSGCHNLSAEYRESTQQ